MHGVERSLITLPGIQPLRTMRPGYRGRISWQRCDYFCFRENSWILSFQVKHSILLHLELSMSRSLFAQSLYKHLVLQRRWTVENWFVSPVTSLSRSLTCNDKAGGDWELAYQTYASHEVLLRNCSLIFNLQVEKLGELQANGAKNILIHGVRSLRLLCYSG